MIDLQLLGGLAVRGPDGDPGTTLPRRRALALVAVVAAFAPQPIAREKLVALLWPESDPRRARNSLRQAMFALRRDLHEDLFLPETPAGVQLDAAHLRVDLCRFRAALSRNALEDAIAAYSGPFLDGFSVPGLSALSNWVDAERDRLQRQYVGALDMVAQHAEREGRADDAVRWRGRQAAADPLDSRSALALLKALAAAGDRAGAIKHAALHERVIREELEVEPNPTITDFVANLRRDAVTLAAPCRTPSEPQPAVVGSAAELGKLAVHGDEVMRAPEPATPARHGRFIRAGWFAAAAVMFLAVTLVAGKWVTGGATFRAPAAPPVLVLGSGTRVVDGRDPETRLVACAGPACPAGALPQDAYVVPANSAYGRAPAGTEYIAPVPDGTTIDPPGYRCCTTATFETTFTLPHDAASATIAVSALADNQAIVTINGVEFGRQRNPLAVDNYGNPARFITTFAPDPSGVNRLRVTLWDGGGALAVQYIATVTHETAASGSSEAHGSDGAPTKAR